MTNRTFTTHPIGFEANASCRLSATLLPDTLIPNDMNRISTLRQTAGFSLRVLSVVFSLLVVTIPGWAQTNPTAQSLPYAQDFGTLAHSSTTYPVGWQGWQLATSPQATFRTTAPTGDRALTASSDASTTNGNVHNYNGKIGFLNSGSLDLSLAVALNTTGSTNVQVSYDIMTIRNPYDGSSNTRINEATLQYRVGTSGDFTTLTGIEYQNNTTTQIGTVTTPQKLENKMIALPAACDNQAVVQLRWASRQVSGSGSRPSFAIDNFSAFTCPITVTTTADEDDGFLGGGTGISLREAIRYASDGCVIELAANATYTLSRTAGNEGLNITPGTGDLDVQKNLTINGNGATIDADEIDRVMQIVAGVTVVINNVTFTNGKSNINSSTAFGGAIYNSGNLTLNGCTISNSITDNSVTQDGHGGGIYNNSGILTMTNCIVSGNRSGVVNFGHNGGGIYNNNGTLIMDKCTVSGNTTHIQLNAGGSGGGIYSNMGIIQLTNCTVSGNTADQLGGGVSIVSPNAMGDSFIRFCTIANNTANNSGGGVATGNLTENVKISNTIIAKNIATNVSNQAFRDVQNGFISEGYNIIGVVESSLWIRYDGHVCDSSCCRH
ncbi:MAG: hypothetical protein KF852_04785 [Saprospiraceae bacterium]|nr:hypothetical protein [Saprospiraceae bacterium]